MCSASQQVILGLVLHFFSNVMVFCIGPYLCLLLRMCIAYSDSRLFFSDVYYMFFVSNARIKMHKHNNLIRPVINSIHGPTYKLTKFISKKLKPIKQPKRHYH
jgi:hypothetical protein